MTRFSTLNHDLEARTGELTALNEIAIQEKDTLQQQLQELVTKLSQAKMQQEKLRFELQSVKDMTINRSALDKLQLQLNVAIADAKTYRGRCEAQTVEIDHLKDAIFAAHKLVETAVTEQN